MKQFIKSAACLGTLGMSAVSYGLTVGEIRDPSRNYLDCAQESPQVQTLCNAIQEQVNQQLNLIDFSILHNATLFNGTQTINQRLTTSCTRSTELKSATMNVTTTGSADIQLDGDTISQPVVYGLTVPSQTYARYNLKDELGITYRDWRLRKKCRNIGSDSYYADTTLSNDTNIAAFLSLEPRMARTSSGDYIFEIAPIFELLATFNIEIGDVDVHGASPFTSLFTSLTSVPNSLDQQIENLFNGATTKEIFMTSSEPLIETHYGAFLPMVAEIIVNEIALNTQNQVNAGLGQIAAGLRSGVSQVLGLNSNGKTYFAFGSDLQPKAVSSTHLEAINPLPSTPAFMNFGSISCPSYANCPSYWFNWAPVDDATRYEYKLTSTSSTASTTSTSSTTNTNPRDARVRACNDTGCSAWRHME